MNSFAALLSRALDGLVHASAADDGFGALRQKFFIGRQLAVGFAGLSALPLWLALAGPPTAGGTALFAWFAAPIAVAVFLSKTGRLDLAHLLSAAVVTGLVVSVASPTGGLGSPVLVWLAIVPFEAALSGSRRVALAATAIAAGGAILAMTAQAATATSVPTPLVLLIVLSAVVYAGGLADLVDALHRGNLAAARSGEERYRLLADNATDMITRHAVNGDVEFASPSARALFGVEIDEILGDGFFRRVHVGDRPAYLRALSDAFKAGRPSSAEFRLRRLPVGAAAREEDDFILAEMRCRPALDADGVATAVVAVTRDITERRAMETALRAAHETAERANLAKSHFLAHMSHELRTPLNAIIGFSEILETEVIGKLDHLRQKEYARLIHASGQHLLQVVNGILDMSKIESGMFELALEPIAIALVIDGCVDMMGHQASERGIRLVRSVPAGMPEVLADRRAVRQILLNLLSNAIKFSDAGGAVTIAVRTDGKALALSVKDLGIGIAAADLPRLGTPFVQAESSYDRRYQGTGLGLSMVKGLAALHGGRLAIESRLGVGTTVTVSLPLYEPAAGANPDIRHPGPVMAEREKELKRA